MSCSLSAEELPSSCCPKNVNEDGAGGEAGNPRTEMGPHEAAGQTQLRVQPGRGSPTGLHAAFTADQHLPQGKRRRGLGSGTEKGHLLCSPVVVEVDEPERHSCGTWSSCEPVLSTQQGWQCLAPHEHTALGNVPKHMPHPHASSGHLQMLTSEDKIRCQTGSGQ